LLDQALEIDPTFAKAHELKAIVYYSYSGWMIEAPVAQTLVYQSANAALALDPTLVVAKSFAVTASPDWNWTDEIAALTEAANAMPNSVLLLDSLAYDFIYGGYFEEGLEVAKRIIELDPLSRSGYIRAADALIGLRRYDEALGYLDGVSTTIPLDFALITSWIWASQGHYDEAANIIERYNNTDEGRAEPITLDVKRATSPENGEAYVQEWIAEYAESAENFSDLIIARLNLLAFGHVDAYLQEIQQFSAVPTNGWANSDVLEYNCTIFADTGCRARPEYLKQLNRWGMSDLWDSRGAPDYCSKESGEWVCD
jgi:tetratricopeptide (TPR) repeat protein